MSSYSLIPSPLSPRWGQLLNKTLKWLGFLLWIDKKLAFLHLHSFYIKHKVFAFNVGKILSLKKPRSGDLLIEITNSKHSQNLVKCSTFGDIPLTVSGRRVILERDLFQVSEEEVLSKLRSQHVCIIWRITMRRDGQIFSFLALTLRLCCPKSLHDAWNVLYGRTFKTLALFQLPTIWNIQNSPAIALLLVSVAQKSSTIARVTWNMKKNVNCQEEHTAYPRSYRK